MSFKKLFKNKAGFIPHLSQDAESNNLNHRYQTFNYRREGAGFIDLLLDFLLVVAILIISIIFALRDREILAAIINIFKKIILE